MSKLLLVDGSALLHRAYHAYPPLRTKTGEIVGAVYGVVSMLVSALDEQEPDQVVVAWDLPKPTFRHELYIAYKAQRAKADVEMVEQIPTVKETIEAMGLLQVEQEGYEADDIIGTLASKASDNARMKEQTNKPTEVVILTGDMDLTQLVTSRVKMLTPPRGKYPAKLYGPEEVVEKYGIRPDQIVDYKALVGDASDNIPGVRGIGPKTASKLIQTYETLDGVYQAVNPNDQINVKTREKLIAGKESAYLSQELSRIECEMEITIDEEVMEYHGLRDDLQGPTLKAKLEELNFRSLIKRIWGNPPSPKASDGQSENQLGLF